jgi:hypothetical protein
MSKVALIYLPAGEGGAKVGLDDYLAVGHTVDDLLGLATHELRPPPNNDTGGMPDGPYGETDTGLVWKKRTNDGVVPVPLANFTARIVADTVEDDGAETRRVFTVEARLSGQTRRFDVPAEQFATMNWPAAHLGARAILYPGQGVREHARTAIQTLSEAEEQRVRAHLGWVQTERASGATATAAA